MATDLKVGKGIALVTSLWAEVDRNARERGQTRSEWVQAAVEAELGRGVASSPALPSEEEYDPGF